MKIFLRFVLGLLILPAVLIYSFFLSLRSSLVLTQLLIASAVIFGIYCALVSWKEKRAFSWGFIVSLILISGLILAAMPFLSMNENGFFSFWKKIATENQMQTRNLKCNCPISSREGYCTFEADKQEIDKLVSKLALSAKKITPNGIAGYDPSPCNAKIFSAFSNNRVEAYLKKGAPIRDNMTNVEFNGLYFNEEKKQACVCLEYPYG